MNFEWSFRCLSSSFFNDILITLRQQHSVINTLHDLTSKKCAQCQFPCSFIYTGYQIFLLHVDATYIIYWLAKSTVKLSNINIYCKFEFPANYLCIMINLVRYWYRWQNCFWIYKHMCWITINSYVRLNLALKATKFTCILSRRVRFSIRSDEKSKNS